jgi:hypothetical protein
LELGASARRGSAERLGIDPEQQVAGRDTSALAVAALEQDARNARAHLDLAFAAQLSRILEVERERARLHVYDADHDGRRRPKRLRRVAPGYRKCRNQKEKTQTALRVAAPLSCWHLTDSVRVRAAPRPPQRPCRA